ncbi:sigma-70 family RNA polymerase sigma factor [Streptomyces sp. NPDC059649]|uniref:sigma-70 family RNA polymerase sigma factor n=1 Tax=Streptomyces sp. NPDC059649 TaxID=3346895 RepID=UPI0036801C90
MAGKDNRHQIDGDTRQQHADGGRQQNDDGARQHNHDRTRQHDDDRTGKQQDNGVHQAPQALTEEQAARILAGMNEVIRAGEEMRKLRTEMITMFAAFGWTQDTIAQLTEMSQPAVSKQVKKSKLGDAPPPMDLSLDQHDIPWLEGRLWGLAEEISEATEACDDTARCTRYVNALARGRKRFTPQNMDELRRLVEEDLRRHQPHLPSGYRDAYDQISRALDVPPKATSSTSKSKSTRKGTSASTTTSPSTSRSTSAPTSTSTSSPSARRTLAYQIQRDQLRGDS